jgi:hypothetical protein
MTFTIPVPLKAMNQVFFFLIPFDYCSSLLLIFREVDLGGRMDVFVQKHAGSSEYF